MASVSESCNAVHDNFLASQDKVGLMPAFYQVNIHCESMSHILCVFWITYVFCTVI